MERIIDIFKLRPLLKVDNDSGLCYFNLRDFENFSMFKEHISRNYHCGIEILSWLNDDDRYLGDLVGRDYISDDLYYLISRLNFINKEGSLEAFAYFVTYYLKLNFEDIINDIDDIEFKFFQSYMGYFHDKGSMYIHDISKGYYGEIAEDLVPYISISLFERDYSENYIWHGGYGFRIK